MFNHGYPKFGKNREELRFARRWLRALSCPQQCSAIYLRERREPERFFAQGRCGPYNSGPELTKA